METKLRKKIEDLTKEKQDLVKRLERETLIKEGKKSKVKIVD